MSESERIRRAFLIFHLILGLALLWGSVHTLLHLGPTDLHARIVGSVEAVGAVAFLIPRTLRFGGALLVLSIVGAILVHATGGPICWSTPPESCWSPCMGAPTGMFQASVRPPRLPDFDGSLSRIGQIAMNARDLDRAARF